MKKSRPLSAAVKSGATLRSGVRPRPKNHLADVRARKRVTVRPCRRAHAGEWMRTGGDGDEEGTVIGVVALGVVALVVGIRRTLERLDRPHVIDERIGEPSGEPTATFAAA